MPRPPSIPPARQIHLPGRGRTWVYDSGRPPEPRPGDGDTPLILLHGWTSTTALNWYRCFPALTRRFRVLALDHRGHGRGISSRLPFRLEDCADDVAALIETLDLGPSTVAGYSMGGPIAQLSWRRHPDAVAGLVLCATAARFTTPGQFSGSISRLGAGASVALSLLPPALRRQGMGLITRRWSANGSMADWAIDEYGGHDPSAIVQAGLALSRFDSTGWVDQIDVPTAVVITETDTTVSPRRQRFLADTIPGARAFPVEGDHRACVESPGQFVPAFLAACDAVRHRPAARNATGR
ncbi:MAG TPA: alpha/beta fold hydrolase [Acidimicrobiales bacterium]|nr:alpha/beta fold hydrolase [Acidimicrobiales bacterium]